MSSQGNLTVVRDGTTGNTTINCASTTTVYTKPFLLRYGMYFGISLIAASTTGTPNLKIQLEQSHTTPTTEVAVSDANYVIGDGVADVYSNLNDAITHIKTLSPVPMLYGRLKITGLGSNPADTTLKARLFSQEIVA